MDKQNFPFTNLPINYHVKSPRFDVNDPEAYKYFKKYGYVVIKNVIPRSDIPILKNQVWDWLEQLPFPNEKYIKRDNMLTWNDGNWPTDPETGIIFSFGVGQTNFMWKIRDYQKVKQAYINLHKTKDLIVSFDGFNLYRPWHYNNDWKTKGKWWHIDQNGRRKDSKGFQCAQGLISLMDANEKTGGLVVIPKSQEIHEDLSSRLRWPIHVDYVPISKKDYIFTDPQFSKGGILVHSKAGDLCLWDGRTIHCNAPGIGINKDEYDKYPKNKLLRMTAYVCYVPRWKCMNKILQKRFEISWKMHVTTTHWPHFFVHRLGSAYIKHNFELNESQKRLIGYPRGWFMEFLWKCDNEWKIGVKHFVLLSSWLLIGKCVFFNKNKKSKKT